MTSAWWIPLGSAARRGSTAATRSTTGCSGSSAVRPHLRRDARQGADVPVEVAAARGRVEEAAQGLRGAGGEGADLLGDVLGDDLSLELVTRHGRDQPRQARAALVVGDRDDVLVAGRHRARDREVGIGRRDVPHRRDLHLQERPRLRRVGDLEDVARADEDVDVALARAAPSRRRSPPSGPRPADGRPRPSAGVRARRARRAPCAKGRGSVREHVEVSRPTPFVQIHRDVLDRNIARDAADRDLVRARAASARQDPQVARGRAAPARRRRGRAHRRDGRRGRGVRRASATTSSSPTRSGSTTSGPPGCAACWRGPRVAVGVDSVESVRQLAPLADAGLRVRVEVDSGHHRSGVPAARRGRRRARGRRGRAGRRRRLHLPRPLLLPRRPRSRRRGRAARAGRCPRRADRRRDRRARWSAAARRRRSSSPAAAC